MSPRVEPRRSERSSFAEYRSKAAASGNELGTLTRHDDVFWRYVTTRATPLGPRFEGDELSDYLFSEHEQRTLSKASGAGGGFLVPSDFDLLVTSARRARNVIAELARQIETEHGRAVPLPTATAHGTGSWAAENASVTASDDTFAQVTVNAYKAMTKTIVSEELALDALEDFDAFLAGELGQRLALLEETAFATGDGSGKPLGITTSGNGVATVTAGTGSASAFKLADVRAAYDALPVAYRPSASWLMSPSAFSSLAGLVDTAGALVLPTLHASEPSLFARPVYVSPELPAAAANARSVVFGDVALGYAVRRVRGLGLQRQEEIHSDSGQIGYRLFERVDGRVVLADALRILVHSAT